MGCWGIHCGISQIPIYYQDKCYLLILQKSSYGEFFPAFVPIEGEYDDYGSLEKDSVVRGAHTELIEEHFGCSFDVFLENLTDFAQVEERLNNTTVDHHAEITRNYIEFCNLQYMWIAKDVYELLSNYYFTHSWDGINEHGETVEYENPIAEKIAVNPDEQQDSERLSRPYLAYYPYLGNDDFYGLRIYSKAIDYHKELNLPTYKFERLIADEIPNFKLLWHKLFIEGDKFYPQGRPNCAEYINKHSNFYSQLYNLSMGFRPIWFDRQPQHASQTIYDAIVTEFLKINKNLIE